MTNSQKFNVELIRATRQQMLDQLAREMNEMYCEERSKMRNPLDAKEAKEQADLIADTHDIMKEAAARLGMQTSINLDYENWGGK